MTAMATLRVRSTPRDLELLRFAGEMYCVPMGVFAELVARFSPTGIGPDVRPQLARRHAARLGRLGYADRRPLLGHRWVLPTRAGLRAAGLSYEPYEPPEWKLRHLAAVAWLCLALTDANPGSRWESERSVRQRWREQRIRGRIPDGVLERVDGSRVAVELELHRKARWRYPDVLEDVDPTMDLVWWFTRPGDVAWVVDRLQEAAQMGRLPARPRHEVHQLPPGVLG